MPVFICFLLLLWAPVLSAQPLDAPYRYDLAEDHFVFFLKGKTSPLLAFRLDQPFLQAAQARVKVKERYGFFRFKERVVERCREVVLDTIMAKAEGMVLAGTLCRASFVLKIMVLDTQTVHLHLQVDSNSGYNRLYFSYDMAPDEAILGLGEQYTHNNLNGKRVPIWVQEQGIGAGDQPITSIANVQQAGGTPLHTYASIPFYLSSRGHAFQLHNRCRAVFDLRQRHTATLEVWDHTLNAHLYQHPDPLVLVEAHTQRMGRQPLLPDWAFGTIVGLQGGRELVLAQLDSLEGSGISVSAIWIQDWVGRRRTFVGDQLRWYWQADEERYPNFKGFCAQLEARGIAVLGYINPMLTNDGPLYQEANAKGYLVKDHRDSTYIITMTGFDVGLLDLTNPETCTWIKGILQDNMMAYGLKGWMADFGEALPWDAVLHSGADPQHYHNQYPVDWARVNREAIEEAGQLGEVVFFSRSAHLGSSQYATLFWAGDQMVSWQRHDGLRAVVPALTSSGICGLALNHADVGGYAGFWRAGGLFQMKRSRRLLQRHIELGTFSPIFRTHEGILPQRNAQVYDTPQLRAFYSQFSRIRQHLQPYLKQLNQAATQKGHPMIRHLYLHYPNDPESLNNPYQYLLGADVLVAPVYKKGARRVRVYLPQGQWQHWFTKEIYPGGQYHWIAAPIGQPAVLVRQGNPNIAVP